MREAERREKAALDYAKAVEEKRKTTETKFSKVMKIMLSSLKIESKTV